MPKKYIKSFDGTKIFYKVDYGNKKAIVFLHGLGGNHTSWKLITRYFHKANYTTIAIDLRGHGRSGKPKGKEQYDIVNFAKDLKLVLEAEKINSAVFVNHCFSSIVALKFYDIYPHMVEKLVLLAPVYMNILNDRRILKRLSPAFYFMLNIISEHSLKLRKKFVYPDYSIFHDRGYIYFLYNDILGMPLYSYAASHLAIYKEDIKKLSKIKVPTLIITGNKDWITPPSLIRRHYDKMRNVEFVLTKEDHLIPIRDPIVVCKEIEMFIK
jgi:pimeloyl-ACP methyl ester carboxylesterase